MTSPQGIPQHPTCSYHFAILGLQRGSCRHDEDVELV